ncbi:hypothetical protein M947_01445 [Sulfurimonas hongkongensis]|uniref:Periplasmic protein n=1 Tax=Sulfurimonas hongkongensis TaxID=1172190 RepID=T0JHA7_9BACT|nr:hypothetical protein [Sulfurimonas hongkongensis]EQB40490.1 hypothetical protein M947_01445 [Sulfurimonas hongkongensis]
MKKLNLTALLLGVALFMGFGVTSASAEGMRCGAGKCGSSMKKPVEAAGKCGTEKKTTKRAGKCGAKKREAKEAGKCGAKKREAKRKGKCGGNN